MVVLPGRILLLPSCTRSGEDSRSEEVYILFFLHEMVWKFLKLVWKKFGKSLEFCVLGWLRTLFKIASAREDRRSNLCSHFQQSSSCCCDEVFTFAIGFRQQKGLAESDGDTSMTTTPNVVRLGLMSKKDRPRSSFSQELSYPRNRKRQQQALAK